MSNEKPVRITVGDVKEVTEATTTQVEEARPAVSAASSSPVATSQTDSLLSGNAILGLLVGILLFIAAGYFALTSKPPVDTRHEPVAASASKNEPAANNAPTANNVPAASNTEAVSNTPAANTSADNNAPAQNAPVATNSESANAPAANNAPADNNAAAANH